GVSGKAGEPNAQVGVAHTEPMSEAVQLRVQQIDGTLGPPLERGGPDELPFPTAVGTTPARDDRRWVQGSRSARTEDGTLEYVIAGELTEQRSYSATGHEVWVRDPSEKRRDSAQYGTLILDGEPLDVGSVDDRSPVWSPDGRYLGIAVLETW